MAFSDSGWATAAALLFGGMPGYSALDKYRSGQREQTRADNFLLRDYPEAFGMVGGDAVPGDLARGNNALGAGLLGLDEPPGLLKLPPMRMEQTQFDPTTGRASTPASEPDMASAFEMLSRRSGPREAQPQNMDELVAGATPTEFDYNSKVLGRDAMDAMTDPMTRRLIEDSPSFRREMMGNIETQVASNLAPKDYSKSSDIFNDLVNMGFDPRDESFKELYSNATAKPDKDATPSALKKYIDERNDLVLNNPNSPYLPVYEQAIAKTAETSGIDIQTNPDGTFSFSTSGRGLPNLQAPTRSKIEGSVLQARDGLNNMYSVARRYKPEFQTIGGKFRGLWGSARDTMGLDISPEDRQYLTDFTSYRVDAFKQLNEYLNSISGAAISPDEAKRLMQGMPNPGTNPFNGQSPIEFEAAFSTVLESLERANQRYSYAMRTGKNPMSIPLSSVPALIQRRGEEITADLKRQNPGMSAIDLQSLATEALAKEFCM